jgi:hypothetical protein
VACARIASDGNKASQDVKSFATTTSALLELSTWLEEHQCTHVVMEASGVYWKPVWHVLEGSFELVLANAQHVRNVPGRKSDVNDAMWLADLLAHGLVQGSFVPPTPIQEVRDLTRTRKQLAREIVPDRESSREHEHQDRECHQRHTRAKRSCDPRCHRRWRDGSRETRRTLQPQGEPQIPRRGAAWSRHRSPSLSSQTPSDPGGPATTGDARSGGAHGQRPRALSRRPREPDDDSRYQ